jgi:hypothetical protein
MLIEYKLNLYKKISINISKVKESQQKKPEWAFFVDFYIAFIYILFGHKRTIGSIYRADYLI